MPEFHEYAQAGMAAIDEKRYADAIEAFTAALAIDDSRPDMNNALGMSYLHRGEVGSAIPFLEKAVTLAEPYSAPEHQDLKRHFHMGMASAYQLADRIHDARRALRSVIERWPEQADAYMNLAALLLNACMLDDGKQVYKDLLEGAGLLDEDSKKAVEAVLGAIEAFEFAADDGGAEPNMFIEAHRESYAEYFSEQAEPLLNEGWYAEAARMAKSDFGDPRPYLAEGARHYARMRVDLVNPADGSVAQVYSDTEPMLVAVEGLEPLAQAPIMLPWRGWPYEVWVCTQCPWHWLQITIQFETNSDAETRIGLIDELIGDWYTMGYEGQFGEAGHGRFHYITDPEPVGTSAVSYVVDLGRAKFEAVDMLMRRLIILHDKQPIRRLLFGAGHLPD